MKIVVTTPTGNIGSKVVVNLLRAGVQPTVIVRDASRLPQAIREQVNVVEGDKRDSAVLDKALAGATSFFHLSPPDYTSSDPLKVAREHGESAAAAIQRHGVSHVVNLSSSGVGQSGFGLIDGLTVNEELLNQTDANVLHLRPSYFFENFLFQLDALRNGAYYSALDPSSKTGYVATRDIAEVATGRLLNQDWTGKFNQPILGPADLEIGEAVKIVGKAIGKEVQYVQIPLPDFIGAFKSTGASQEAADLYAEMVLALDSDTRPAPERTLLSQTPTTLGEWAYANLRPLI